ncbi:hypothetical protein OSB04_002778 [Centaurea solstitialis]|uniref:DUF4371 domain-containing protein n=1 Tax=Centaurea solstitialis TaxID=347529 RepID=A0AA38WN40_9ASTR|nr:hypothetical protein OSB04_002778 [Centaurea solstitialis]
MVSKKEDSHNKGNFIEILQWLADQCDVVDRVVLKNAPRNTKMKCGDIQKDIVQACYEAIIIVIMEDLGNDLHTTLGEFENGTNLKQEVDIKRPCDTRWLLGDIGDDNSDNDRKSEALRIFKSLNSFNFVFCLHLMVDILGVTVSQII